MYHTQDKEIYNNLNSVSDLSEYDKNILSEILDRYLDLVKNTKITKTTNYLFFTKKDRFHNQLQIPESEAEKMCQQGDILLAKIDIEYVKKFGSQISHDLESMIKSEMSSEIFRLLD